MRDIKKKNNSNNNSKRNKKLTRQKEGNTDNIISFFLLPLKISTCESWANRLMWKRFSMVREKLKVVLAGTLAWYGFGHHVCK